MPIPNRLLSGIGTTLAATAVILLAAAGGWWFGWRQAGSSGGVDPRRSALTQEVTQLRRRLDAREASDAEKQRLLELLVALDRKEEAIRLLEPMADQEPDRWSLRLLLAELRRDRGDRAGAERELRLILNRKPDQVEALQLITLIRLEQGRGQEAEAAVRSAYGAATTPSLKPEALAIGLLLADLQQRRQQAAAATATYGQLAQKFPTDQRPLLGLAMLHQNAGNTKAALEALEQARLRSPEPGKPDPRLDRLAASWGLEPLRAPASAGKDPDGAKEKPTPETTPPPTGPRTP
jgi:tetratricopeptide (TPR) repeat protein